jgi:dinuclear metal center YbgI/SA1388 family protein
MPKLSDVVSIVEEIAPPGLAAEWDNTGLQVGDPAKQVRRVLVSLDPLPTGMDEAVKLGCDLIVSHHPLFFRPVRSLDLARGQGMVVDGAIKNGVAIYSAHTSLDRVPHGVSDALASPFKLKLARPLKAVPGWPAGYGFGIVGELPKKMKAGDVAVRLKDSFKIGRVKLIGDPHMPVKTLAMCGGSGSDLIEDAAGAGADAFVTGDIKYHEALDALSLGICVLDVGHFHSELPVVARMAGLLKEAFKDRGWKVDVRTSKSQEEPWSWL